MIVNIKHLTILSIFILITFNIYSAFSQEEKKPKNYFIKGYIKDLPSLSFDTDFKKLQINNLIHNRINTKWYPTKTITGALEIRNRFYYDHKLSDFPGYDQFIEADDGIVKLSKNIFFDGNVLLNTSIDRLWVDWSKGDWQIRAGRQRINWGTNLVFNPNDLFNTYSFIDFDYEERPGSDAIRVQYYTGFTSQVELVAKMDNNQNTVIAGYYKFNKWNYDFQFLGGKYYNNAVFGFGWAGDIKGAGFRGELTTVGAPRVLLIYPSVTFWAGQTNFAISGDYTFKNSIYLSSEILYNSNGIRPFKKLNISDLSQITNIFTSQIGVTNLSPAKYTFYLGSAYSITPLIRLSLGGLYMPINNGVFFGMPSVSISIKENWDLMLLSQIFKFEGSGLIPGFGHLFFTRVKWSFASK